MERKTMIGLLALFVFFAMTLGVVAMEPTACEEQRADDGQEWHHRTRVGGKPGECWYVGKRMKPRRELHWRVAPILLPLSRPAINEEFEDRWGGVMDIKHGER
jgi:hypothetical protein